MIKKKILITGVAGFIGFHLAKKLLNQKNYEIIGIDNFDKYYSIKLKKDRLKILNKHSNFKFSKIDICNQNRINSFFKKKKFEYIYHLAAQAGVRYSIENPKSYINNNIYGFFNILECIKINKPKKIFYASSSSVYGDMKIFPLVENKVSSQKNVYSLSKKFNEDIAEIYSNIYKIKLVGLRFFTVYGEWGRPDMFYLKYLESIRKNEIVKIHNFGKHLRDFTYIRDVVDILQKLQKANIKKNHDIFNICSNKPISLMNLISIMNKISKSKARTRKVKLQMADVIKTHGDNKKILKVVNKKKFYDIKTGIKNTINWYNTYKF
tara:strand:+ start:171 stop:1136 length:966 start_codon:yes stop_codon:yes gene_type:complete